MTTPTTNPTNISGAETMSSVSIASRPTPKTSGPVIATPPLSFLLGLGLPLPAQRGEVNSSNLHLQNVLIGGDHFVAHRDERLEGGFGFRDRGDDVDHIGLAGGHGLR